MCARTSLTEQSFELFKRHSDLGDFYGFTGPLFRTRTGEITVRVQELAALVQGAVSPAGRQGEGRRAV